MPRSENAWSYIFNPQYVFKAWCLVKHRDKFTFLNVLLVKNLHLFISYRIYIYIY